MIGVLSEGDAVAVAALITAFVGGPIMWFLVRFDRRNSAQHDTNQSTLQEIKSDLRDVKTDVREVKWDVRELKEQARSHDHRLDDLENPPRRSA